MCPIRSAGNSYFDVEARHILLSAPLVSPAGFRTTAQLFAVALTSAALAGCTQSSVANKSELLSSSRQSSNVSSVTNGHVAMRATDKHVADTKNASYGLASFYADGVRTASGEKFDPHELTAAHPTLPFGSRLRVTNVATGRSVIVRVTDRGPFVPGRMVDVSHSAAETLGIIGRGVAKVKVDVVQ